MNIENEINKWENYYASLSLIKEDRLIASINQEFSNLIGNLLPSGGKSLELGCGAGWQSLALARIGNFQVSLLDFSQQALHYAKTLYDQERIKAEFIHKNGFEIGSPEYDIVFNAGVLEHYSFNEQVALLQAMASYSRKYVLVLIPNQLCYWYWIWRTNAASETNWPFGQETPLSDVNDAFTKAGLNYIGQAYFGETWTESLIESIAGLNPTLRRNIINVHKSSIIPIEQKSYLIAALGRVDAQGASSFETKAWHPVIHPTSHETSQFLATISDALALSIKSQNDLNNLKNELTTTQEQLTATQEQLTAKTSQLNEIYKSRSWKMAQRLRKIRLAVLPVDGGVSRFINYIRRGKKNSTPEVMNFKAQIDQIINSHLHTHDLIIFLPSIKWDIDLFQRPQQLALSLSKLGNLVFYCQPVGVNSNHHIQQINSNLFLANVPMEAFSHIENPVVIALSYNRKWINYFSKPRIVYDYIDELEVFKDTLSMPSLKRNHEFYIKHASFVVATAENLYEKLLRHRKDALLIPNGVDYDHFQEPFASNIVLSTDFINIVAQKKPIIGYYGALARWFDYKLLEQVASARPNYNFVLIGPNYDDSMTNTALIDMKNIFWLGAKKYSELPVYLHYFTACIIPFILNDITHSTSPLKLFEYMAARKPVVITPMRESMRIDNMLVASNPNEFVDNVDKAIELSKTPHFRHQLGQTALEHTWDSRATQLCLAIHPDQVGPNFKRNLEVYINKQAENIPEETRQMWLSFAQQSNKRGFYVCEQIKRHTSLKGKSYLDIGCAYGGFLIAFHKNGCRSVIGIDLNADLLDLAKINLNEHNVVGKVEHLSVESDDFINLGRFDIATCNDVLEHVDNPELTIQQISHVMNPGGLVYFEIPNPFWPGFLAKDGHYNLPGITLLSRHDALRYYNLNYRVSYGVGYYHTLRWYMTRLASHGFKPQWILKSQKSAIDIYEDLKENNAQMLEKLNSVAITPELKEKILHRSDMLLQYCSRRIDHKNESPSLNAMFGVDFWNIIAIKQSK